MHTGKVAKKVAEKVAKKVAGKVAEKVAEIPPYILRIYLGYKL